MVGSDADDSCSANLGRPLAAVTRNALPRVDHRRSEGGTVTTYQRNVVMRFGGKVKRIPRGITMVTRV